MSEVIPLARRPQVRRTFPAGTVAVVGDEAARFTVFASSMQGLELPPGTRTLWKIGNDIAGNRNISCSEMTGEWIWFIDDDHAFGPDILQRLLRHDVDIVAPNVLRRQSPFLSVGCVRDDFLDLASQPPDGLIEVQHTGSSGMLIRRRVIEALEPPWFELGNGISEDVSFCQKAREAGFDIFLDLGTLLGHVTTAILWPHYEGGWKRGISIANGFEVVV